MSLIAGYHTTKFIAHKASYSKLRPKKGQNWLPWQRPSARVDPIYSYSPWEPCTTQMGDLDRFSWFCIDLDVRRVICVKHLSCISVPCSNTPPASGPWLKLV